MSFEFGYTKDVAEIEAVFNVSSVEWAGGLLAQQFCETERSRFQELNQTGYPSRMFYLRDVKSGTYVTSAGYIEVKGFYKLPPSTNAINTVPDVSLIGVSNATFLCVTHVFTAPAFRKLGLAGKLVQQMMEFVENELVEKEIAKSNDKSDSFKNLVVSNGHVDRSLANYYLGSKYFWYLYSAVGNYYEKFGFKPYPIDFYTIPLSLVDDESEKVIESLLAQTNDDLGKSVKLLNSDSKADQDLIQFILQSKEIEILSELNKLSFHSELQASRKSSTSLHSFSSLQMTPSSGNLSSIPGSGLSSIPGTGLSSIPGTGLSRRDSLGHELIDRNALISEGDRKASVVTTTSAKVALKPDYKFIKTLHLSEQEISALSSDEEAKRFGKVQGAIVTNKAQQKSYYVLWVTIMYRRTYIIGMGEVQYEQLNTGTFGATGTRRRGSSFTGVNDLGAYNLKDLELLLQLACYVTKKRKRTDGLVYVSATELPFEIPDEVLHDFLTHYLNTKLSQDKIEAVTAESIRTLPMMRKFGAKTLEFDLDWNFTGVYSWS